MKFSPEKYPIIVQVIDSYLMVYSPDFDYRIAEKYDPHLPGQTELLIMRLREHLLRLSKQKEFEKKEIPPPSTPLSLMEEIQSDYLSSKEAARLLRISHDTLTRMARQGKIPYTSTPGGHRRFKRSDLETSFSNK